VLTPGPRPTTCSASCAPARAGEDRHPDHPQAARDHGDHRHGVRDAARRDGGDRQTADTSPAQLAELMVGRKVLCRVDKTPPPPGQPVLEVENLRVVDIRAWSGSAACRSRCARARSWASRASRATARASSWRCWAAT
jgi:hypothetical protein